MTATAGPPKSPERPPADGLGADGSSGAPTAPVNRLLRSIPSREYERLGPHLIRITVASMQLLTEAEQPLTHVYFPDTAVISVLRRLRDGTLIETGTVGRDGMAGLPAVDGITWSPSVIAGQVPGVCHCMTAARLRELLPELPTLTRLLDRYRLSFADQLGQIIACNSLHSVEQRCIRWLLMAHDRAGQDEFHLTHEVLSQMLAVRRAGVTEAALALQRAGLITYTRGRVTILDRTRLEAVACECHAVMRARAERLMAGAP